MVRLKTPREKFKAGERVEFQIGDGVGSMVPVSGKVTRPVPKNAKSGNARLFVRCDDGVLRRPYPSQCVRVS